MEASVLQQIQFTHFHHLHAAACHACCPHYSHDEDLSNTSETWRGQCLGLFHQSTVLATNWPVFAALTTLRSKLPATRSNSGLILLLLYHAGEAPSVSRAHADWGTAFQARFTPLPSLPKSEDASDPDRQLIIGYISPDLFTHSVSYFAEAPLAHHGECTGMRHIVYDCTPRPDAKTELLEKRTKAAGGLWRPSAHLSEAALADQVSPSLLRS